MIAQDLINYLVPPLKLTDEISKAKLWMHELRLTELPVTEDGRFLGLIDEEMLFDEALRFEQIKDYPLLGQKCMVKAGVHYYDVLKVANQEGFRMVAVLDDFDHYVGVISIEDVVEAFAKSSAVSTAGAIIALRLKFFDYSLAEISRIIEINEAKVLSSYLAPHPDDPADLQLTLKINKEDISYIIASLEQFGFHVENSFNTSTSSFDERERIDGLMKYLKI